MERTTLLPLHDLDWDSHVDIDREHKHPCAAADQPSAALLTDIRHRGLLDDTLVIWGGEFGRTPVAQVAGKPGAARGRDNHPHAFNLRLAGGGMKPGLTYGAMVMYCFSSDEMRSTSYRYVVQQCIQEMQWPKGSRNTALRIFVDGILDRMIAIILQSFSDGRAVNSSLISLAFAAALTVPGSVCAAANEKAPSRPEVRAAIDRGLAFLQKAQNSNGWWSTPDQPAVTALVLTAMNLEPTQRQQRRRSSEMNRGFDYILSCAKTDGSIHKSGLANYNTSLSVMALTSAADTNFLPVILKARGFLASTQIDRGIQGTNDTPFDGGVGYGSKYDHSDMNNTLAAIEAMRASEAILLTDVPASSEKIPDLDWKAVAQFLQNCQNLPGTNRSAWVSSDPKDRGGFVYYPGHSMAGGVTNSQTGRVALRSYGSMSYGGLLSYIYADLAKDDPRVVAVKDWLRSNYTIDENPGMGQQGYFYYLHLLTKALNVSGEDRLKLANGEEVRWRNQVAARLLRLQKADGSWVNPEPRWWETDPVLVTSYAVMTLELLDWRMP